MVEVVGERGVQPNTSRFGFKGTRRSYLDASYLESSRGSEAGADSATRVDASERYDRSQSSSDGV